MENIHTLSSQLTTDPDLIPKFVIAVQDLDSLWESLQRQNNAVLDDFVDLDLVEEFSITLETEVRLLYVDAMAEAAKHRAFPLTDQTCKEDKSDNE